jgi:hypothetical protein
MLKDRCEFTSSIGSEAMNSEFYEATRKLHISQGEQQYHLDVFGDHLAKKYEFKEHTGIEAVWYFLIERYHWTPSTVRALNTEDLVFLLAEEMSGWQLPADAKPKK